MTIIAGGPIGSDDTPASRLKSISDEYIAQMYSIIEINRSVIPEMAAREVDELARLRDGVLGRLSREEQKASAGYLTEIATSLRSMADAVESGEERDFKIEVPERGVGVAVSHLFFQLFSRTKAGPRENLLRKSLLVSAISTFEVLFGRLARTIYTVNTSALNDSEYSFSLQELAGFASLDDAREYLAERKVSALLRESVDGWEKWLKKSSGGLSMESLPVHWPLVREAFARRNLVVHTGGVVNHLYLSILEKLDLAEHVKVSPGSQISVHEEYLDRVAQELLALGRVLVCALGAKLYKHESNRFTKAVINSVHDCSMQRSWHASRVLSEYAMSCSLDRRDEMLVRVRNWHSRKRIAGLENIRQEVEHWDTSGLEVNISSYKKILLEDFVSAVPDVQELISQGRLSRFELATDPIYEGLLSHFAPDPDDPDQASEVGNEVTE
ncbi:hypothetical protein [Streptomyces sp. NRRL F-5650]|uniref:hypothetical protein n=1 Tax=Streptomyces sp. NRRL F-5650 TaxID=1463868 RepID=UPI00131AAF0F|nr:hypothetical protein [Streptomyces sp. NRRL F-5650]